MPLRLIAGGVAAAAGLIISGVAVYDFANLGSDEADAFGIEVSAGIGLYPTLLGGLVILGVGTTVLVKALQNR